MPIFEYICPVHGTFEKYIPNNHTMMQLCEKPVDDVSQCGKESPIKEFSVPGKRNPEYGIQK